MKNSLLSDNSNFLKDVREHSNSNSGNTSMKRFRVSLYELLNTYIDNREVKETSFRMSMISFSKQNYQVNKCTLVSLTLLSACGTFYKGYNEAVFDTMEEHMHNLFEGKYDNIHLLLMLVTTILTVGAIFGALICGMLTNSIGRKNTILLLDVIAILGTILTVIENPIIIVIGRFFTGMCLGGFTTVSRLYMVEMSPIQLRPRCMAFIEIFEMLGVQVGYLLGLGFYSKTIGDSEYWWRIMFGLNFLICGLHFLITLFFFNFDTPLFTYVKRGDEDETNNVLNRIYKNQSDVQQIFRELKHVSDDKKEQNKISYFDLFKNPKYSVRCFVGFIAVAGCVFVGSDALIFYSNTIFLSYTTSEASTAYTNIIGFAQLLGSFIAVSFVEHLGRRKLFILGYLGLLLLLLISGTLFLFSITAPIFYIMVAIIVLNVTTVGPVTHLYIAEILPEKGLALAYGIYYLAKVILTLTFKPIVNSSLEFFGLFYIYGLSTFLVMLFIIFKIKETHGKTIVQLEALY